ncbi:MAG TPA: sigma-70 family RNA polymerase sigma factor [Alphaproteobacteria bacterium]|nr:sigma-70 family RNA polymerase sigma factor [Alphaproteobacteria bacterium]
MGKEAIQDYELIQKCCSCDHVSKEEFIQKYTGLVYHVCFNSCVGLSGQDCDDFAQTAWLHIFSDNARRLRMYRPQARFSTWFTTVLLRLCSDFLRKQKKPPVQEPNNNIDPIEKAEIRMLFEQLSVALSDDEKQLIDLYISDVPTENIMKETGIEKAQAVHKKIFTIKQKLRREAVEKGVVRDDE